MSANPMEIHPLRQLFDNFRDDQRERGKGMRYFLISPETFTALTTKHGMARWVYKTGFLSVEIRAMVDDRGDNWNFFAKAKEKEMLLGNLRVEAECLYVVPFVKGVNLPFGKVFVKIRGKDDKGKNGGF